MVTSPFFRLSFLSHNPPSLRTTSSWIDSKTKNLPFSRNNIPPRILYNRRSSVPFRKQPPVPRRREEENKDTFINPTRLLPSQFLLRRDTRAIRQPRNFTLPPNFTRRKKRKKFLFTFPFPPILQPRPIYIARWRKFDELTTRRSINSEPLNFAQLPATIPAGNWCNECPAGKEGRGSRETDVGSCLPLPVSFETKARSTN